MRCSFFLLFIFIFHCNCLKYIRYILSKSKTIPSIRNLFNIQNVNIQSPISTALQYTCFINSDYHVKKIDRERAINEAKLEFENRTRDGLHFRDDIYKDDVKIIDKWIIIMFALIVEKLGKEDENMVYYRINRNSI